MKIPHLKRDGSFRPQIRKCISELEASDIAQIALSTAGGYKGNVTVEIGNIDEVSFEASLELSDWTRFPARIRAAATELRDQGFIGTFKIYHDEGILLIERRKP